MVSAEEVTDDLFAVSRNKGMDWDNNQILSANSKVTRLEEFRLKPPLLLNTALLYFTLRPSVQSFQTLHAESYKVSKLRKLLYSRYRPSSQTNKY